jgi:hypothetical protein
MIFYRTFLPGSGFSDTFKRLHASPSDFQGCYVKVISRIRVPRTLFGTSGSPSGFQCFSFKNVFAKTTVSRTLFITSGSPSGFQGFSF